MNKLMHRCVIAALVSTSLALTPAFAGEKKEGHGEVHWGYEGHEGPSHWGDMKPEYGTCKTGHEQSPVDIKGAAKGDGHNLEINYQPSALKVINNGHTVQVNYDAGSTFTLDGKTYNLVQFHFHTPSEYIVNGKAYPMEWHLVHKSDDGKLAVIGVFFKEGKKNDTLETVWKNLPKKVKEENVVSGVQINAKDLLPANYSHWHLAGSLTTPPCSEGVTWTVMQTPLEASKDQIKNWKSLFKVNARPVQPLHGRQIIEH